VTSPTAHRTNFSWSVIFAPGNFFLAPARVEYFQNTLCVPLWGPCEGNALIEKADWWTILDLNQ
jgi:hypothetical protein